MYKRQALYEIEHRFRLASEPLHRSTSSLPVSPRRNDVDCIKSPDGDITTKSVVDVPGALVRLLSKIKYQTHKLVKLVPAELHDSLPKIPFELWL